MTAITRYDLLGIGAQIYGDLAKPEPPDPFAGARTRFGFPGYGVQRYGSLKKRPVVPPVDEGPRYVGMLMDCNHIGKVGM